MKSLNIAVVGSGVAGLAASWLLASLHRVTLYEQASYLGGHANTVDVETPEGPTPVDTGFIVYNEQNYPNLTALFETLGVPTQPTEMSFSLSANGGAYEYAGAGFNGFFGQRSNLLRPRHWRLLREISLFFATAEQRISTYSDDTSLGDYLTQEGYSAGFIENHIVPMGAAIWSTSMSDMLDFPARSFINFYANHGMLQFRERPAWRNVTGGSRNYVALLQADGGFEVQRSNRIRSVVRRDRYVYLEDEQGAVRPFDHVVIATHADQALVLLDEPRPLEQTHLGSFTYQTNRAVLHRDRRWMPKRRQLWSSWNYLKKTGGVEGDLCVTYWMNRLQNLQTATNLFLTLNPTAPIHPKAVEAVFTYKHPVFEAAAHKAQKELWALQGAQRTWFCGSYFGSGFHEDGAQSGLAVAEQLGGIRRPWRVENESGRIPLPNISRAEAAE